MVQITRREPPKFKSANERDQNGHGCGQRRVSVPVEAGRDVHEQRSDPANDRRRHHRDRGLGFYDQVWQAQLLQKRETSPKSYSNSQKRQV